MSDIIKIRGLIDNAEFAMGKADEDIRLGYPQSCKDHIIEAMVRLVAALDELEEMSDSKRP